jgi:hypothetical protein
MNRRNWILLSLLLLMIAKGFTQPSSQKDKWESLFNGKDFSGWNTYIGPPLDDAGKKLSDVPVGLNNDPAHVFTIVDDNGENVIRISGQEWGAVFTTKAYENFHLQLKFKWGNLSWGQKKGKKKDSGLLYFSVGDYGADYGAWMRSQEFQIEEGNCGDYWGVAGGKEDIPATKISDSQYVYDPAGQMYAFNANSAVGRHCIKRGDAENASGQWNILDLYCHGDTSVHVINGKVMMVLYHSQQYDNGKVSPLTKGKLQVQSEGAEVFYKDIRIMPVKVIPSALLK